jgi:hypothetical protein
LRFGLEYLNLTPKATFRMRVSKHELKMKVAALISLTLLLLLCGVALGIGFPPAAVQAEEGVTGPCAMVSQPLDEGYGVSRTVMRRICVSTH